MQRKKYICCSGSTGEKFTDLCELQSVPIPTIQLFPGFPETVEIWILWVTLWRSLIYYLVISHSDCTASSNQIRWFPLLLWPALCSHTPFPVPRIIQQGESNRLSNLRINPLLCSLSFQSDSQTNHCLSTYQTTRITTKGRQGNGKTTI